MSKPIKIKDLNVNKITFTKLEDNDRVTSQKIGFIQYNENQLIVQSPEIKSEVYGIPRQDEYHLDIKSRAYYKLGLCHERHKYDDIKYKFILMLYNKFIEIDNKFKSEQIKKELFGNAANNYEYIPLVRIPEIDTEIEQKLDKKGDPVYRPPFIKFKLDLEYNSTNKLKVKLFECYQGERTKIDITSFDDLLNHVKFLSKLRFIISFAKIYAMKTKNGSEKKKYGIVLKITHIEVQRPIASSKNIYEEDVFDSDTEDVVNNNVNVNCDISKLDITNNENEENDNEDDEEDENEENENEDEDEDEDDEEDVVEEIILPIKKQKQQTKQQTKQQIKSKN
jgi:hypothetical protein